MAKYDVDRFETPPDEDLICCICQCVLDNPLESPCRHVFCKVCIETWLTNRSSCPNCRKRVRVSKLKPVLPIVRNMINRLLIVCENREHGCIEGIKLEMYDSHVQNCDFAPIKCLNTGCGSTVLRQNMLVHEQSCKYRLIMCKKGCGLPIPMEQAKKHNCLAELKKSMAAMEDQYQQRLRDLENKLSTRIQALEERMRSMEENCHQDQNSWGSIHSTEYATPEYANSEERDADIANVIDYVTNHMHSDEDNSLYYSGDEDEVISTPEYQEQDGDYFEAPRDTNSDETSPQEHGDDRVDRDVEEGHEEDVVEEEVEDRDSDSAFFLNNDSDSNNDSDGDLNDSLLDSSDGEVEPVQVYEVSPTSPSSDRVERLQGSGPEESQNGDSSDDIFHMPSGSSPQIISPDGNDVAQHSSHRAQSDSQSSNAENPSRGNQPKTSGGGELSPHREASFGSLTVEYNSSGRSSPHGQELVNISDHSEVEEESRRTGGGSAGNERPARRLRDYRGRNRERTDTVNDPGSRQGRRKKRGRSQDNNTSRGSQKPSRNSKSRLEQSNDQTAVTIVDLARRADDLRSSVDWAASSEASRDASQESRGRKRKQEYLYGIPLDEESDSSVDPSWERASQEGSTDITISDEFSSSFDSFDSDSSPEVYKQFLTSLGSVPSSESDETWTPGDPDDDEGWESERDVVDSYGHDSGDNVSSCDDSKDDSADVEDVSLEAGDTESSQLALNQSLQRTSQESQRSPQGTRSRHHSQESREDEGGRSSPKMDNQPNSESDSTGRSLEGSKTKRPLEVSSSESEEIEEEDHHPIWKRRRSGDPSQ